VRESALKMTHRHRTLHNLVLCRAKWSGAKAQLARGCRA